MKSATKIYCGSIVISHEISNHEIMWFWGNISWNLQPWDIWVSHWQESRSRKISRRNDSLFSRSLEKTDFSFLFLFSIFKICRKKFNFSSRFVRFLKPFSFYSWFSRFLRKNSLSLLDWWDSETQISFSSWFSRFWEKISFSSRFMRFLITILFLFSIFKIFRNKWGGGGGAIYTSKRGW